MVNGEKFKNCNMNFAKCNSSQFNFEGEISIYSFLNIMKSKKFKHKIFKGLYITSFVASVLFVDSIYNTSMATQMNAGSSSMVSTNISGSLSQLSSYDKNTLNSVGCDQEVWQKMVNNYATEAQRHVAVANQMQVQNQVLATPELVTQCFDQAVQIINTATKAFNSIMSFLSGGGIDSGMLKEYAKKVIINEACSQFQSYVYQTGIGSIVSQGSGMVDSMLSGDILGTVGNFGNTPINAGDILNNSGFKPGQGNVIPTLNSNDIVGGVNNAVNSTTGSDSGGFWNSINPFK